MPKRNDIKKVLVVGSGPIVIGQACEFDYSGTQAIKALREEGVEVVLLNSNPATVMTDPEFAHRTYLEPITVEAAERIIATEKPDSLLPTMGGQTALNLAKALAESGVLAKYGVRLIGASLEAINRAEDRQLFKEAMERIGLSLPKSGLAHSVKEAQAVATRLGFPVILRPSFTLAGTGGGVARNEDELIRIVAAGLQASPMGTVLVEESVLGWKEFELEVVRDTKDNAIVVCSIENLDPMGIHTGDSITVAPVQTLTDKEYQRLREASLKVIREIGVETGGSNVQFAINPRDGRMVVIEMNPRVSRSSALASKATGYPIARVAAKLALGYALDELANDITKDTPASFEPTLDYVVVKIPRFNFEKFPAANDVLDTTMRSVGEVMAIGRTFKEAYGKALRSLELGRLPLDPPPSSVSLEEGVRAGRPDRPWFLFEALRRGMSIEAVHELSAIDPWFLRQMAELIDDERELLSMRGKTKALNRELVFKIKQHGFSDAQVASLVGMTEAAFRAHRESLGVRPVYKRVDTCAAEFEAKTPYLYSTYEEEDEAPPTSNQKVLILGSGPIRIGQGVEFDYCCVHAAFALREAGFETIMVNCNPETVSTDFDTSDRLYFEPLTFEDVLEIARREKPLGAIVQFGGQTPLKLAHALEAAGVPILGTSPEAIDRAEDRERFAELIVKLQLLQPENGAARSEKEALEVAHRIGYPVMVRPSYVLGGRAMEIVYDEKSLRRYMTEAVRVSNERPVLIDRFLKNAIEVDVDLVRDQTGRTLIGGVLEHIEEAGVHSGDAACTLPPHSLAPDLVERLKDQAVAMAQELSVVGLMNVQFAIQGKAIYVLEVNPRASRTVPFVAKATGIALAKVAALLMAGKTLHEFGLSGPEVVVKHCSVKEAVFPFARFSDVDVLLGPEMRSTGEVMGISADFADAFGKSQLAAGVTLPRSGRIFLSVKDEDKPAVVDLARRLQALGFSLLTTSGTRSYLEKKGVDTELVRKANQDKPNIVERIEAGDVALLINTTAGYQEVKDSLVIRRGALLRGVPYYTTAQAARMLVAALESQATRAMTYRPLQDFLAENLRGPNL